jgi:hypothetical protein
MSSSSVSSSTSDAASLDRVKSEVPRVHTQAHANTNTHARTDTVMCARRAAHVCVLTHTYTHTHSLSLSHTHTGDCAVKRNNTR